MRLALCIFKYFPYGGLQRDFLDLALTCRNRGHRVSIFTQEWDGPLPVGLHLHLVRPRGLTNHGRTISFVKQTLSLLHRGSFEVVVGFNKMPGLDLYFSGDSCYAEQSRRKHGLRWNPYYWATPRFRRYSALERAVLGPQSTTDILILTDSQQQTYMAYYGTPAHRFHLLPPGICQDRNPVPGRETLRAELRQALLRDSEELLLLAVGADAQRKGLDRTIHAMASLPRSIRNRTRLVAVGEHRTRRFEKLAARLCVSDRVTLLAPRPDIARFFYGADLLTHPARSEPGGNVLLESMAYGLPVLATDVCGYAACVQAAQGGFIIPSPFEQGYMNRTLFSLLTTSRLSTLAQNARAYTHATSLFHRSQYIATIIEARATNKRSCVSST